MYYSYVCISKASACFKKKEPSRLVSPINTEICGQMSSSSRLTKSVVEIARVNFPVFH